MADASGRRWSVQARRTSLVYLAAKNSVISRGYGWEIDWQETRSLESLDESTFLREAAWVILCSGFRESVVRSRFLAVSQAFLWWSGARRIWASRRKCRVAALQSFGSRRKIDGILVLVDYVAHHGFDHCREQIWTQGLAFLTKFPLLGPATGRHLAKNLGVPTAKPDRHLTRIAFSLGYADVAALCAEISQVVGDPVPVVDLVFWRFATLARDYPNTLASMI